MLSNAIILLFSLAGFVSYSSANFDHQPGGRRCNRRFTPTDQCPVDLMTEPGFCNVNSVLDSDLEPEPNKRSCFRTCVESDSTCNFLPRDRLRNVDLPIAHSPNMSMNYMAPRIFSPNFFSKQFSVYRKCTICRYNVQCPPGRDTILFFNMVTHDLEENRDEQNNCIGDFLVVDDGTTNVGRRSCGSNETLRPGEISGFALERLRIEFRSNRVGQTKGFFMISYCVATNFYDLTGCRNLPGDIGKRKREAGRSIVENAFHIREKRYWHVRSFTFPVGFTVRYDNYVITVFNTETNVAVYRFGGIRLLRVYSRVEGYLDFSRSARRNGTLIELRGYGELLIGRGVAYCVQTVAEPRFLLTEKEETLVKDLFRGLVNLGVFADEAFDVEDELDEDDDPLPTVAPKPPPVVNPMVLERAKEGMMACNGVVRAVSEVYLDLIKDLPVGTPAP